MNAQDARTEASGLAEDQLPFIDQALESLHRLVERGYSTAGVLELVFTVLNELPCLSPEKSCFSRKRICARALRLMRESKCRINRDPEGPGIDPVVLLLRRALRDFEEVVLRLFSLDWESQSQRELLNYEIANLAFSIITAERLSGRTTQR